MSYTAQVIIAVALAVMLDLTVWRTGLVRRRPFWVAYAIIFGFQLVTNGILTGLPVVTYDPDAIIGLHVANAPVEDLGFGFALVLLTLSSWIALGPKDNRG